MFQTKVVQNIKTRIRSSVTFFFEIRVIYEILWKYIVERSRAQMTIWPKRIACR